MLFFLHSSCQLVLLSKKTDHASHSVFVYNYRLYAFLNWHEIAFKERYELALAGNGQYLRLLTRILSNR